MIRTVKVKPVPGTTLAENKDEAARLRDEVILPAVQAGKSVTIDFDGIETATQSYVHALVADVIRRFGDASFELLLFRNCSPGVQHIVRTVFEYTLLAQADVESQQGESNAA